MHFSRRRAIEINLKNSFRNLDKNTPALYVEAKRHQIVKELRTRDHVKVQPGMERKRERVCTSKKYDEKIAQKSTHRHCYKNNIITKEWSVTLEIVAAPRGGKQLCFATAMTLL